MAGRAELRDRGERAAAWLRLRKDARTLELHRDLRRDRALEGFARRPASGGVGAVLAAPGSIAGYAAKRSLDRVHPANALRPAALPGLWPGLAVRHGPDLHSLRTRRPGRIPRREHRFPPAGDLVLPQSIPALRIRGPGRIRPIRAPEPHRRMRAYAVVSIAALDLRRRPDHRSEMRSQLLLGETVRVLAFGPRGQWWRVESRTDRYRGWARSWGLRPLSRHGLREWERAAVWRVQSNYLELRSASGRRHDLGPIFWNSRVAGSPGARGRFRMVLPDGSEGWTEARNLRRRGRTAGSLDQLVERFRGVPYLWGGRTPFGLDCSGFVQQVMAGRGILTPRDAHEQFLASRSVAASAAPRRGDLLFCGRPRSRMAHVGIALGRGLFAHARGTVRLNSLQPSSPLYDKALARSLRAVRRPPAGPRRGHSS